MRVKTCFPSRGLFRRAPGRLSGIPIPRLGGFCLALSRSSSHWMHTCLSSRARVSLSGRIQSLAIRRVLVDRVSILEILNGCLF